MSAAPLFHGLGAFDSQNLAFWDPVLGKYRAYWRIFTAGVTTENDWRPSGIRAIRTATSDDFLHWSKPADLTYTDSPPEHLYSNQVKPYTRAPHLLLRLNFATSAAGVLRVELQRPDGQPLAGFTLADCHPVFGDTVDRAVAWKNGANVGNLKGQPVRLRFELKDADLYALQFA